MPKGQLRILIEGNDDERFFERIRSVLMRKYSFVQMWKYRQKSNRQIVNFLKSIKSMNSCYFFLTDLNRSPCVLSKKNNIRKKYGARIDIEHVVVVVKAIEGWYLAGLDDRSCKELGIKPFRKTDNVNKEKFNNLIPKKFDSRIDFMIEILKRFSVEIAKQKNKSFAYFMSRI